MLTLRRTPTSTLFPYTTLFRSTAAGGGYSRWRDLAVTRWQEDPTRDGWGTFCYLRDRKSTRLNSSHGYISYAVFCLKKKNPISFGLPFTGRCSTLLLAHCVISG